MSIFRRKKPSAAMIPVSAPVDPHIARTVDGNYVFGFSVDDGASFETADDETINQWYDSESLLWRSIASPHLSVWTTLWRTDDSAEVNAVFPPGFARDLNRKYAASLSKETLMRNRIFIVFVYRPNIVAEKTLKLIEKIDRAAVAEEIQESIDQCNKLRQEVQIALGRYNPVSLGEYEHEGRLFCSLKEYFGLLVNGIWQRMAVARSALNETIGTTDLKFGVEVIEYRTDTQTLYSAILGCKQAPIGSAPCMFGNLLKVPFSFILTQSFTFLQNKTAIGVTELQLRRKALVRDFSQVEELNQFITDLSNNEYVAGDWHFSLNVFERGAAGVREDGKAHLRRLNDHIADAKEILSTSGMISVREGLLALRSAFWAQLPGNFKRRSRMTPVTSLNFSAMNPLHNFPAGRATGGYWGNPLTTFLTRARTKIHFAHHVADVGHAAGIGPTGSGKTVTLAFLAAAMTQYGATQVVLDKDKGLRATVLALGGQYQALENGQGTGINPLQWEPNADNVDFMRRILHQVCRRTPDDTLTVSQERDIERGLQGVLRLPRPARRLSRLIEFLDKRDPEGMRARLAQWCEGGPYGWVLDNETDVVASRLHVGSVHGFDVTDFLDNPRVRTPITMCLLHLIDQMADGRRMVVWADEFAKLLDDPEFTAFSKDGLEGWRKDEVSFLAFTQMASHVLGSAIARSIVEQALTKFAWSNPGADFDEYTALGFSEREIKIIREELQRGQFLIKQNYNSFVVKLPLAGFEELDVLSGRAMNLVHLDRAIEAYGNDPQRWLPDYYARVRKARSEAQNTAQEIAHAA